jgi:GMP synthase-like glutamine amidotransferase
MLLLINNKRSLKQYSASVNTKLSSVPKLKRALAKMKLEYYEVKGVDETVLDPASALHKRITGIVISGSSLKLSQPLNISQYVHILRYLHAFHALPVLGICFGAQLLVYLYGGTLRDQGKYTCKKLAVRIDSRNPLFSSSSSSSSSSSHHSQIDPMFCFSDLPIITTAGSDGRQRPIKKIKPIAWLMNDDLGNSGHPVAYEFERGQVYGCLFHPEWDESTFFIFANAFRSTR